MMDTGLDSDSDEDQTLTQNPFAFVLDMHDLPKKLPTIWEDENEYAGVS